MELKELLADNLALLQRLKELGLTGHQSTNALSKLRDIQDPLTWVFCFMALIAAKSDHQEIRDLLTYAQIIIQLARKYGGQGWLNYDVLFH